jgi:spore maturation protein CgeB
MRLALTGQDYKYSLGTGRLTLCLGADLIQHLPSMPDYRLVMHPVLREFYEDELLLTQEAARGEYDAAERRWVGLGMGGVVYNELSAAVRAEGYSVFPLEVRRWDPRETRIALKALRPERVVTINYDSEVASVCHELEIPLVAWEVDPKTDRPPVPPAGGEDFRVFTLHPKDVSQLEDAGFSSVGYLPIGVDTDRRYPIELNEEERSRFAARVCFVGSSLIDRARRFKRLFLQLHASFNCSAEESFDETSERLERVLAAERANYGVYDSDKLLEEHFGEFLEAAHRNGTPDDPKKWVAEIVASQKRIAYVSALSDFGIHVWGDERWTEVSSAVPGVHYRGLAEQGHELTCVYSSAEIHVDVNRIYQPEAIPMRVINVMACGGFLIAEHSESIEELFEVGKEIETYRTIEELEAKVAHYLEHPGEAREIAQRGLEAVRQRHTMRIRAASLLA